MLSDTILVIDDQPAIRQLLAEILTEEGYQVVTAANGNEGIQQAKACNPQLVLLDMKMPGINGIETLQKLNKDSQGIRVIMMTAYGELELMNRAREIGACDYITKPFDLFELCQVIHKILLKSTPLQMKTG